MSQMNYAERRALERKLKDEFPDLTLHLWYRQYRELKAGHPDAVLFYRFGDFYETFDDDAKLVAELMDVTLTRKDRGVNKVTKEKNYAPMAGMPYHAVENYVAKLVGQGYRIAIAEQMSETASSKSDTRPRSVFAAGREQLEGGSKLVEREVVRVITPGTLLDPALLSANQNNYLGAVLSEGGRIGFAYADLSTGEFAAAEFVGEQAQTQLEGELARLQVAEVLVPDDESLRLPGLHPAAAQLTQDLAPMTKQEREVLLRHERVAKKLESESAARWTNGHVTAVPTWRWEIATGRDALLHQLGAHSLGSFGLGDKPLATRAAGAVIQYLRETQRSAVAQITTLRAYTTGGFMFLDPQTRRNLELLEGSGGKAKGSLVSVLDHTRTPMGARLLRRWLSQPLLDVDALRKRHDAVERFVDDGLLRTELRERLRSVGDMERATNRILQGTTVATPRDLARLREGLRAVPGVIAALGDVADLVADGEQSAVGSRQSAGSEKAEGRRQEAAEIRERGAAMRKAPVARVMSDDLFGDEEEEPDGFWPQDASTSPASRIPRPASLDPEEEPEGFWPQDDVTDYEEDASTHLASRIPHPGSLDPCTDLLDLLERALDDDPPALLGSSNYLRSDDGGEKPRRVIRPGYDARMDEVVKANRTAQSFIDKLEGKERDRTGLKNLKVDYNKVFGYYIEVSRADADRVPGHYVRKQTLVGSERYITAELKEYEAIVLGAQERLKELEEQAFARLCQAVANSGARLLATAQLLAQVDVYAGLAEAAVRGRYVRPTLNDGTTLRISCGRHPVVERVLDEEFVPNDAELNTEAQQLLLITGPNMAGKSTILRQIALIVLMAQIGSFVPADEAEIGLVDRIFTRIGAQDDIATGQSTFMVEMTETAAILLQSTRRSLIVLDEVGRGTSTYDGMAIARATVEYIHNEPRLQCRTLFATHYHELTALEQLLPRVRNFHMAAIEQDNQVVFLHELRRGSADRSYGIHVAQLAGIPSVVIKRASELLAELEGETRDRSQSAVGSRQSAVGSRQEEAEGRRQKAEGRGAEVPQQSLFDIAPSPVIEMIRRMNVNELTPIEALTKLYELQKLAGK